MLRPAVYRYGLTGYKKPFLAHILRHLVSQNILTALQIDSVDIATYIPLDSLPNMKFNLATILLVYDKIPLPYIALSQNEQQD